MVNTNSSHQDFASLIHELPFIRLRGLWEQEWCVLLWCGSPDWPRYRSLSQQLPSFNHFSRKSEFHSVISNWPFKRDVTIYRIIPVLHTECYGIRYLYFICTSTLMYARDTNVSMWQLLLFHDDFLSFLINNLYLKTTVVAFL